MWYRNIHRPMETRRPFSINSIAVLRRRSLRTSLFSKWAVVFNTNRGTFFRRTTVVGPEIGAGRLLKFGGQAILLWKFHTSATLPLHAKKAVTELSRLLMQTSRANQAVNRTPGKVRRRFAVVSVAGAGYRQR